MNVLTNMLSENMLFFGILIALGLCMTITAIVVIVLDRKRRKEVVKEEIEEVLSPEKEEEQNRARAELEHMMKQMEADLEENKEVRVSTYEQEQEEKAIISYQELVNSVQAKEEKKPSLESTPISENKEETVLPEEIEVHKIELPTLETKKNNFQSTEFISPIFGKVENKMTYPTIEEFHSTRELESPKKIEIEPDFEESSLDRTINLKPLNEEIKKNEDFLESLKEFRKNL